MDLEADENFSPEIQLRYTYKKIPTKYTQYVHRTGAAFVQVVAGAKQQPHFLWSENRLLMSRKRRSPSSHGGASNLESEINEVRDGLVTLCSDSDRISSFWKEIMTNLATESGLDSIADDAVVENNIDSAPMIGRTPSNQSMDSFGARKSITSPSSAKSQPKKIDGTQTIVGFVIPEKKESE